MKKVFEQIETQWQDHVVKSALLGIDHVLQALRKGDKEDDGAGASSGGNAVW